MSQVDEIETKATVHVENIGGISETDIDLEPGVTVLTGRNATNRTSFLRALMAAMGSNDVSLKGDADYGEVLLKINDREYERTLRRQDGTVRFDGDPYLQDTTLADLFAFLLESNEARCAVARADGLQELIMRPIDVEEIQTEIEQLESRRQQIDAQLAEIDALKDKLPSLEQHRQQLKSEIDEKRNELSQTESEIAALDTDIDEKRAEKERVESRLQELRGLRSELEEVRGDIEIHEKSIASLRRERAELEQEWDSLAETEIPDRETVDEKISRLRENKRQLESEISDIQNVVNFNEEMLGDGQTPIRGALQEDEYPLTSPTDRLVEEETALCWTCGTEVQKSQITSTIETLKTLRQDYTEQIRETEEELADLRETKSEYEQQQRRRNQIEAKLEEIKTELDDRQTKIGELRERRNDLSDQIETIEKEVETLETTDFSKILDLHKHANEIELEIERLESKLHDVNAEISDIEDQLTRESRLRAQREQIQAELEDQRTRIDRIERDAISEFNDRMDEVLDILNYDNLSRIWIERVQEEVRDGRGLTEKSKFKLHVVRASESGITYEDTIDHLSESEREVTGLIFALAGYLIHDVHEKVPFMLLDSLEAIDSERLADIVTYLSEETTYLIVALLPEDAQALPAQYRRIRQI